MSIASARPRCRPLPRSLNSSFLALTLAGSVLVGCTAEAPSPPADNRFLVEPVRLSHQVTFASGQRELSSAEHYALATFLDEVDPDGRADIYLDAHGEDKTGRIGTVAAALDALGRESLGTGGGAGSEHGVTVTLMQDVVLPESCLNSDGWPQPHLPPASCTTALTLVRMVENQDDLLHGREMGPALSQTAAKAAARHLQRRAPASAEERDVSSDPETAPLLPPSPLTRDASY